LQGQSQHLAQQERQQRGQNQHFTHQLQHQHLEQQQRQQQGQNHHLAQPQPQQQRQRQPYEQEGASREETPALHTPGSSIQPGLLTTLVMQPRYERVFS